MSLKSASINEIKKELQNLDFAELSQLCLSLAKYKKDNKEFLDYLLFHSQNQQNFIENIKLEIETAINEVSFYGNLHLMKKGLRKIVRLITKYCKYINTKNATIELLIHFCKQLKSSNIPFQKSPILVNMYQMQLKKINKLIAELHEDFKMDFENDLQSISL